VTRVGASILEGVYYFVVPCLPVTPATTIASRVDMGKGCFSTHRMLKVLLAIIARLNGKCVSVVSGGPTTQHTCYLGGGVHAGSCI
jgi:hypothetical protein